MERADTTTAEVEDLTDVDQRLPSSQTNRTTDRVRRDRKADTFKWQKSFYTHMKKQHLTIEDELSGNEMS